MSGCCLRSSGCLDSSGRPLSVVLPMLRDAWFNSGYMFLCQSLRSPDLNLSKKNFVALKLKNFNEEINNFLHEQLLQQNLELRQAHQKSLTEMKELKKL